MSPHSTTHLAYRAIEIRNTLGLRRAAGYLRNRGVSPEIAVSLLCPPNPCPQVQSPSTPR
jgi:hypothetical protein